ncbi:MAG TPA: NAD-dependent epimerase/dehydratase family protein [Burkholderiaceae bacterium]|nr:NAD-dependent epimerase/dehydratase family protein [Burkholderiaceae bacterium]
MILLTGAAGFIGAFVARALTARGETVLGIDNLNDYYDPQLKRDRLAAIAQTPGFTFRQLDIADRAAVQALFAGQRFTRIVHLAAQAGVRYSFTNPHAYADANLTGFLNLLEGARGQGTAHFVYASSSSVYGANTQMPFAESDRVDHPVSLYAATKRANELMAEVYARQFKLPLTGLRFFTVYGPWGRPDMAPLKFTRAILAGEPIEVYNHGDMQRDFTFVDDIVDGVLRVLDRPPAGELPHRLYNLGNHRPERLLHFITVLAAAIGREPQLVMKPMQPGDVQSTYADITAISRDTGWAPRTGIESGLPQLVGWVRDYYG